MATSKSKIKSKMKSKAKKKRTQSHHSLFGAVAALFAAAALGFLSQRSSRSSAGRYECYDIAGRVKRVKWTSSGEIVRRYDEPVILEGSPASSAWPAFDWTPQKIQAAVATFRRQATVEKGKEYIYQFPTTPIGKWLGKEPAARLAPFQNVTHNVSAASFFESAAADAADDAAPSLVYKYVQGWKGDFERLSNDVSPRSWLRIPHLWPGREQLWLGYGGGGTRVHFDHCWNFVVQIKGEKEFILSPPSEWQRFKDFPRIHPNVAFSQLDFSTSSSSCAAREKPRAWTARVGPGDVLYIPPFYWHHTKVVSTNMSIGLTYFTNVQMLGKLEHLSVPSSLHPHLERNADARLASFYALLTAISRDALGMSSNAFASSVFNGRYKLLIGSIFSSCDAACPPLQAQRIQDVSNDPEDPMRVRRIVDAVHGWSDLFPGWSAKEVRAVAQIVASDYLEDLLVYVLGDDPASSCAMWRCFQQMRRA